MQAASAVVVAMLIALAPAAAFHQQTLPSRTLLAIVSAGNRQLVDLEPDDFVIEEGGSPREVFDVHIADYPLAVLVDNTDPGLTDSIRAAATRFVSRIGQRGVVIGTLTSPVLLTTFDDARAKVLSEIDAISATSGDRPVPLEGVMAAIKAIQGTEAPFSAVVVASAHAIDPDAVGSPELLTGIYDSRIPVHVIALRPSAIGSEADADLWRDVSRLTRGQYTAIYSPVSYSIALDRLADRLAAEMMIQFLVPPDSASTGEVRVGVKIPGARVTGLGVSR
jgi:hypothetical protein